MKKLIVLSVIFALVAGSVFAADVGVEVIGKATLLKGSSEEKLDKVKDDGTPVYTTSENKTGYGISRARISASGATEDGTIGGSLRYDVKNGDGGAFDKAYGWVWWKPSELFRLQIGSNGGDGEFGLEGVAGWNYYQLNGDVVIDNGNVWGGGTEAGAANMVFRNAFFGGWNAPGIMITSKPIEALTINLAFPINGGIAWKEYKQFTFQATYNIDGVGLAGITYQNSLFEHGGSTTSMPIVGNIASGANNDNPTVRAYFNLTSIENLGVDIGIGYKFSDSFYVNNVNETGGIKNGAESTYTVNNPIYAGVGVSFSSGALGVKARVLGGFGGNTVQDVTVYSSGVSKSETTTLADDWGMIINVQPSYAINETLTAYLSLGIGFSTGNEYIDPVETAKKSETVIAVDDSSDVAWHVQPYIVITPSYWSGAFFAGFRLESPNRKYQTADKEGKLTDNRIVDWSIPIGIRISF